MCLLQRPAGLVQAGGVVLPPFPHLFPPPLGPSTPRVEADVLTQSSRCHPAHQGNYYPPVGSPAAAPQGKCCRGVFLGGTRCGSVGTLATPGVSVGLCGLTQLEMECLVGPSMGRRLLPPSVGCAPLPSIFAALWSQLVKPPPLRGRCRAGCPGSARCKQTLSQVPAYLMGNTIGPDGKGALEE